MHIPAENNRNHHRNNSNGFKGYNGICIGLNKTINPQETAHQQRLQQSWSNAIIYFNGSLAISGDTSDIDCWQQIVLCPL